LNCRYDRKVNNKTASSIKILKLSHICISPKIKTATTISKTTNHKKRNLTCDPSDNIGYLREKGSLRKSVDIVLTISGITN